MPDLNVSFIQSSIHWHDPGANLAMFEEKILQITDPVDLVILPEMFNTGFSMDVIHMAEPMNGPSFQWQKRIAAQKKCVVAGTMIIKDQGDYFNRLVWMNPDGSFSHYDKRHLFRMAGENNHFLSGDKRLIVELKGWRICPITCYDLRFPVWSRNTIGSDSELDYDLLLYLANWPASRVNVWDTLLKARAIENLSYVIGVNRAGTDGIGTSYNGHSNMIDFKGNAEYPWETDEKTRIVTLKIQALKEFLRKFPAHHDSDSFDIVNL